MAKKNRIPEISNKRLKELCKRIKPVERFADGPDGLFRSLGGWLYYIRDVNPRNVAFTWDPKPTERAIGLKELCCIDTYHTFAAPVCFKPTIAEVIAQIPEKLIDKVVAFETLSQDLSSANIADDYHHVTQTILYGKE